VAPTTVAPTTTAPDPDVVPAVITPAYVDAVFAVLNHIWDNSLRTELTAANVTPEAAADLRAIFNDPLFDQELKIATQELPNGVSNLRDPPGDQLTKVIDLISSSTSCIFVKTKTNVAAVVEKIPPQGYDYFELTRKTPANDPSHLNPTPWALSYDLFFTGSGPKDEKNPCFSS